MKKVKTDTTTVTIDVDGMYIQEVVARIEAQLVGNGFKLVNRVSTQTPDAESFRLEMAKEVDNIV